MQSLHYNLMQLMFSFYYVFIILSRERKFLSECAFTCNFSTDCKMSNHGFSGSGGDQSREEKPIGLTSWQPQLPNQQVMLTPNFLVSLLMIYPLIYPF